MASRICGIYHHLLPIDRRLTDDIPTRSDGRTARDRFDARARRSLLHADSRRPRRGCREGRTSRRRRDPRLGPSVSRRRRGVFHRHQPQQAFDRSRPCVGRRPRRADEDARNSRRAGREFQARHPRQVGHRQRFPAREIPEAGPTAAFPDSAPTARMAAIPATTPSSSRCRPDGRDRIAAKRPDADRRGAGRHVDGSLLPRPAS